MEGASFGWSLNMNSELKLKKLLLIVFMIRLGIKSNRFLSCLDKFQLISKLFVTINGIISLNSGIPSELRTWLVIKTVHLCSNATLCRPSKRLAMTRISLAHTEAENEHCEATRNGQAIESMIIKFSVAHSRHSIKSFLVKILWYLKLCS